MRLLRCCRPFLWVLPFLLGCFTASAQQIVNYEDQLKLDKQLVSGSFMQTLQNLGNKHGFRTYFVDSTEVRVEDNFRPESLGEFLRGIARAESLRYFWFDAHTLIVFPADRLEDQRQRNFIESISQLPGEKAENLTSENVSFSQLNTERKRKVLLKGTVVNGGNAEPLYGSSIYFKELEKGVVTDFDGNFQLYIPPGVYHVSITSVGFDNEQSRVFIPYDGSLKIRLFEKSIQMKEAVVTASRSDQQVNNVASGQERLDIKTIEKIPAFLGEVDVIRSITMLPGISTTGEGSAGFQVRGGSTDQNLVLLDGVPLFQTSHLFGFFSAFHPDAVAQATVYKGSMPAEYGGRISSVLDVRTIPGNQERLKVIGGIGLVSSRLALEGPLAGKNTTFSLAGRASYSDWILKQVKDLAVRNSEASFHDIQGKLRHRFSDKDQLVVSGYVSADRFKFAADTLYQYKSKAASVDWNHLFSNQSLLGVSSFYSEYNSLTSGGGATKAFSLDSDIRLYGMKADLTLPAGAQHQWKGGVSSILYSVNPGVLKPEGVESTIHELRLQQERGLEHAVYVSDLFSLNSRLSIEAGLRYSFYQSLGAASVYKYKPNVPRSRESIVDTLSYSGNSVLARYGGFEPRLSIRYLLNFYQSVKLSYNRTRQYIHLVSNTSNITPVDVWKLSNMHVSPQLGDQLSIGYFWNSKANQYEFSAELYYKKMEQLMEYQDGAQLLLNPILEADLLTARGRAYGGEFMVKKKEGKLSGWASYTYSRSLRQVVSPWESEQINKGAYYPANFDKPHDLTIVGNYQASRRWRFSANFTYNTGRPTTYAEGRYRYDGVIIPDYSERNNYRIPDYHRLDLSVTLGESLKKNKRWTGSWTLSVYNVYGRKNAYSVYFKSVNYGPPSAYSLSILGVPFPSLTYNFNFR